MVFWHKDKKNGCQIIDYSSYLFFRLVTKLVNSEMEKLQSIIQMSTSEIIYQGYIVDEKIYTQKE